MPVGLRFATRSLDTGACLGMIDNAENMNHRHGMQLVKTREPSCRAVLT